jgi:NADP-dependent aldehyde dehydrogenase
MNKMRISGKNFIGNQFSGLGDRKFNAINPANGEKMLPDFFEATMDEVNSAAEKAAEAFQEYRNIDAQVRADFLDTIAVEIENSGHILVQRCGEETGLPEARIIGERGRTTGQLRLFANMLREGSWVNARIDTGNPDRVPLPKPDVRSMQVALGPVGIFGASNFPLAFSVAGGDTASALAAGCAIVVKAHPAHPGTSEIVGNAIRNAAIKCDIPDGTFNMVHGPSVEVGMAIVTNAHIKAVGFTGSFRGGKALYDAAVQRKEPIPVYAEMGSVNPVFILPGAMRTRTKEIAEGLTASITLGVGQFCTNPGLAITEECDSVDSFYKELSDSLSRIEAGTMLTQAICKAYNQGRDHLVNQAGVQQMALGLPAQKENEVVASIFRVKSEDFLVNENLEEEVFGPSSLLVSAKDKKDLTSIASKIKGHLTASLFATNEEIEKYRDLIHVLEQKVGRLIINGFPTGVEVCHAMIHGGPFPATSDSRSTSVGTASIYRFTRPLCYQNFPDDLLPIELQQVNSRKIWRLFNGEWTK